MSSSVLIVPRSAESYSTHKPENLFEALFPTYDSYEQKENEEDESLAQHWETILGSVCHLDEPLIFRCARKSQLPIVQARLEQATDLESETLCLVKEKTLRRSESGTIQICRVGKLLAHGVVLTNQFVVTKSFDVEVLAQGRARPLEELVLHYRLMCAGADGILPLLGCLATPSTVYAIFPYAPEGDMFDFLSAHDGLLSETEIRDILRKVAQGVHSCHLNYLSHRDISLENLLRQGDRISLIDFGLSVDMDPLTFLVQNKGPVGKHKYMAPELVEGGPAEVDGRKLDVWSLGVTLFMLMTSAEPFRMACSTDNRYRTLILKKRMRNVLSTWGISRSSALLDLLENMLNPDPSERFTMEEVLSHPFLFSS